jgi:hypothetical protein
MRVMMMIKGDPQPGAAPSDELLSAMGRYNDELTTAGVLIDLAGLLPTAAGARITFAEGVRTLEEGPFDRPEEQVAGYWILDVNSMDEAVGWAQRVPFEALARIYPGGYGAVGEVEVRQVFEMDSPAASG